MHPGNVYAMSSGQLSLPRKDSRTVENVSRASAAHELGARTYNEIQVTVG